jgi:hypothetical protein
VRTSYKGQRFGSLVIIREIFERGKQTIAVVRCDCGREYEIQRGAVTGPRRVHQCWECAEPTRRRWNKPGLRCRFANERTD